MRNMRTVLVVGLIVGLGVSLTASDRVTVALANTTHTKGIIIIIILKYKKCQCYSNKPSHCSNANFGDSRM